VKKLIVILLLTLCLVGCNSDNKNTNYYAILEETLTSENLTNTATKGYTYYIPRGIVLLDDDEFNQKLKYNSNNIYIYTDIVSYYYKKDTNYTIGSSGNFYFKSFEKDGIKGYIEINKYNDKYFLEIMYNYAKLESFVNTHDLENLIRYSGSILSSIVYNDVVIENLINSEEFTSNEKSYDILKPKDKEGNFLEYMQEYDVYYDAENELPEEKSVNNEQTE